MQSKRSTYVCPTCGTSFDRPPSQIHGPEPCCSQACYYVRMRGLPRKRPAPRPIVKVALTCPVCSKTFERFPSRIAAQSPACSRACRHAALRGRPNLAARKPRPGLRPVNKRAMTCHCCGKTIHRYPSLATGERIYCSRACRFPNRLEYGKSKRGSSWPRQRRAALERDGHACRHCGVTAEELGYALQIAHIISFRTFGMERHVEANQIENLLTLCARCHALFDYANGTRT